MLTSEPAVRRWEFGSLGGHGAGTATDLEARRRKAAEDGFQAGFNSGQSAAQAIARRLEALLAAGANGLHLMEERLAGELLDLAVELARQVVRAEIAVNREAVLPVVREALALLSQDARAVQVVIHPADAELLRQHLADDLARGGWRVLEDRRVEPGGVRVLSSSGEIDATLTTRWQRALATLGQDHAWHARTG
jgi:flagellar assembly protein FliH